RAGSRYLTELEDAAGRTENICSWLKRTLCIEVTCDSKGGWDRPTELIEIRKVCNEPPVTRMKSVNYEAGSPPRRHFEFERASAAYAGDDSAELKRTRQLAEQGQQWAQRRLAAMYEAGKGVPQDYEEAVKWYRIAAAQEDDWAQMRLGSMYAEGKGVPQDYEQAAKWYRLAAAEGHPSAQMPLGAMYAHGTGVPRDRVRAYTWLTLAAASSGDSGAAAAKNRDRIAAQMTAEQIDDAKEMAQRCRETKLKNCD